MAANYEIVKYAPRFKRQVAELQGHLWGPNVALNLRYLEWKHEENPYVDEPLVYLAFHGGELVGMRSMFGARWEAGSREFLIPCAADLVIAPEHRDRGLFPRIMEATLEDLALRGYEYVFNMSAGTVTRLASLTMGWRGIGSVEPMSRRDPSRSVLRWLMRRGSILVGGIDSRRSSERRWPPAQRCW